MKITVELLFYGLSFKKHLLQMSETISNDFSTIWNLSVFPPGRVVLQELSQITFTHC